MKPKKIIYGQEVRNKILSGVSKVERAVGTTLGSQGRNVVLEKNWGEPVIIHDGVTVARDVILPDPFENQAARLVIRAALNTNQEAGDGTTTATILTNGIVAEAMPLIAAGAKPQIIRRGIDATVPVIIEHLRKMARPVKTVKEMIQIATIAAADEDMGKLIATAIQKVGEHGVVTVQPGTGSTIEVEYKEGMDISKGWISPYLVTDSKKMEIEFSPDKIKDSRNSELIDNFPFVLAVDEKIDNEKLITLAEKVLKFTQKAKFLIIAEGYDPEAIRSIVMSKVRSGVHIAAIESPEYGEHRTNMLSDIATVTGGKLIGGSTGIPVDTVTIDDIGQAEKIIVSQYQTIIIGGRGKKQEIQNRIEGLRTMLENSREDGVRDKLQSRMAKLSNGVAVISVGAPTKVEMDEKRERINDAVNATRAAITEGIVPGGGVALVRVTKMLEENKEEKHKLARQILRKALLHPIRRLITNTTSEDPGYIIGSIAESKDMNLGYNVDTEQYENMLESGIIDPVKVTRSALKNAASVATMLITADCIICVDPELQKQVTDPTEGIGILP